MKKDTFLYFFYVFCQYLVNIGQYSYVRTYDTTSLGSNDDINNILNMTYHSSSSSNHRHNIYIYRYPIHTIRVRTNLASHNRSEPHVFLLPVPSVNGFVLLRFFGKSQCLSTNMDLDHISNVVS